MMKHEFEDMLEKEVSQEDYDMIEQVYTFHPAIEDSTGKETIVTLYRIGGMRLMKDMLPTANEMDILEREISKANARIRELADMKLKIRRGD